MMALALKFIGTTDEPVRVDADQPINYRELVAYIRAWPDKLVNFVAGRLSDDDMREFAAELYEECCWPDKDGPDFRKWVES